MSDPNAALHSRGRTAQIPLLDTVMAQEPIDPQLFFSLAMPMAGDLVAQLHASGRIHGSLTPLEFVTNTRTSWPSLEWDVIFFQMLTGSLPFAAKDELGWFHSHMARTFTFSDDSASHIPQLLQRIILKLLSKDCNDRYQSANGLIHDLKHCREHQNEECSSFFFRLPKHQAALNS